MLASSPARSGLLRNRSITALRVGSARAASVASTSDIGSGRPDALTEPPVMAAQIDALVDAIAPVVRAVVVRLGLRHDGGTRGARALGVGLHIVDVHHHRLGVDAARAGRRFAPGVLVFLV